MTSFKRGECSRFSTLTLVFFARRDSSRLSLSFNSFTCCSISSSSDNSPSFVLSGDFLLLFCCGRATGDGRGAIPFAWSIPSGRYLKVNVANLSAFVRSASSAVVSLPGHQIVRDEFLSSLNAHVLSHWTRQQGRLVLYSRTTLYDYPR